MDETAKMCIVVPCYNEARHYLGRDVPGSKVGALDFFRAMRDLWRTRGRYLGPS